MANTNPARGMRDFLPTDVRKRDYVIGVIKDVYESYGFEPLETPSVENLETLTGKYGEEGSQLMFKILKRGEKLDLEHGEKGLSDLALRYDLTVPLARVVANYKDKLPKFFKRYQIQPVWRADRPARGRYREFYQCDVDAIGSSSMIVEAELISAVCEILERLGFKDFEIKLNNRKVLAGILSVNFPEEQHSEVLVALDKIDKIGVDGVLGDMLSRGIDEHDAKKFLFVFSEELPKFYEGNNEEWNNSIFEMLRDRFNNDENAQQGLDELNTICHHSKFSEFAKERIKIDLILARGLTYYTGAIIEIVLTNGDFSGSIAGGGRYDGLIGMFGKEQIPACGLSIGLERILFVMEERGMFPPELQTNSTDVMVTIWNEESIAESLKLAKELRSQGLRVLVYPEADKLGKQFKYAGQINVPFVCILGESELAENKVAVKNMVSGEQEVIAREEVAEKVKSQS